MSTNTPTPIKLPALHDEVSAALAEDPDNGLLFALLEHIKAMGLALDPGTYDGMVPRLRGLCAQVIEELGP